MTPTRSKPRSPDDALTAYVRARDLREMGLTRTDADFVMRQAGAMTRFGRSVYAKREDVERVLAEHEKRWTTRA